MVTRTRTLANFSVEKNQLITHLTAKIASAQTTTLNKDYDNRHAAELTNVQPLLDAIEAKFKRCQTMYWVYFADLDYSILAGSGSALPFQMDCTIDDATLLTKHTFMVNDPVSYKELIDYQFQSFVLMVASLYENLVCLAEVFAKKVIVFINKPLSTPMRDYLDFHQRLLDLDYRTRDELSICLDNSRLFLTTYVALNTQLRNRFNHGFLIHLETDGTEYFVSNLGTNLFRPRSTELLLNEYAKTIVDGTDFFIRNLMTALYQMGNHTTKLIPS